MKPYTHPADARGPTFIGGKLVHPGETVFVEGEPEVAPLVEQTPVVTDAAALLQLSISKIKEKLGEQDEAGLQALLAGEKAAATPRSTLIAEIEAELLKRKVTT